MGAETRGLPQSWTSKEAHFYRKNRKPTQPGLIEIIDKNDPRHFSQRGLNRQPNRADYRAAGYHGSGDAGRTVGDTVQNRPGGGPRVYIRKGKQVLAGALRSRQDA